jgi:hypothetical protein
MIKYTKIIYLIDVSQIYINILNLLNKKFYKSLLAMIDNYYKMFWKIFYAIFKNIYLNLFNCHTTRFYCLILFEYLPITEEYYLGLFEILIVLYNLSNTTNPVLNYLLIFTIFIFFILKHFIN